MGKKEPRLFATEKEAEDYRDNALASLGVPSRGNPYGSGGNIQSMKVCKYEEYTSKCEECIS
jgi:hypothetical protein